MVVTVDVIFSKNNKIGSKIIAKGTKHLAPNEKPCSHVALLINKRWVHESTGKSGVHVESINNWKIRNELVETVNYGLIEYQDVADRYREIKDKKYDYKGLLFLALSIISTFFGFKLPKKNKWESKNRYFCCEAVGYLTGEYYGMSAPIQVMHKLKTQDAV